MFNGRYGDVIKQYEVSFSRMLNDIPTLDHCWLLTRLSTKFPPCYRDWPSPNYEWFPWSICNGCGMPIGNAYPSGHLVSFLFRGLHMFWLLNHSRMYPNFLIPTLTLTELRQVSMEHLWRVWDASRERLSCRIPGSVPLFRTCLCSNCWDQIPRTCHLLGFSPWIPLGTFLILLMTDIACLHFLALQVKDQER